MNDKIAREVSTELESTQGDRFKCPFCKARRGISWSPDAGDTGLLHCFGCQLGMTGVQFLARLWHGTVTDDTIAKVCEELDADLDTDRVDRAERRVRRRRESSTSDAEKRLLRVERARDRMTPTETRLYDALVEESRVTPHEEESKTLREDIALIVNTALSRNHFLDV